MIDTRAAGQEFQDQVLAAARKGRQRVTTTVKTVTATAHQIRPQLPKLPTVHIGLPTPAQLREKAPAFVAKLPHPEQLREKAPAFIAKLPHPEQLRERAPAFMAKLSHPDQLADQFRERAAKLGKLPTAHELRESAEDLTGHVLAAQRHMISQVRSVTTPLAKQAAAVFAQVGQAAKGPAAVASKNGEVKKAEPVTPAEPTAHAEAAKPAEPVRHVRHPEPVRHEPAKKAEAPAVTKPAHTTPRRAAAPARKTKTRPAGK